MSNTTDKIYIAQAGLSDKVKKSRLPARLDLMQSLTGLFLALFMWGHMFFVGSIIFGKNAMGGITKFFEGYYFFGKAYPGIVSLIVAIVFGIFVVHALLAVRKFPINYKQFRVVRAHAKAMNHQDTTLWMWQVYTGFALFFLASAHLGQMFFWPEKIGPIGSSGRVWSDNMWPYYLLMLLAVELHAGIGLYRLAVKWCWPNKPREQLKKLKWYISAFFIGFGVIVLAIYMFYGYQQRDLYKQGLIHVSAIESPVKGIL